MKMINVSLPDFVASQLLADLTSYKTSTKEFLDRPFELANYMEDYPQLTMDNSQIDSLIIELEKVVK